MRYKDRSVTACPLTRREFVGGVSSLLLMSACTTGPHPKNDVLRKIELTTGGRTGTSETNANNNVAFAIAPEHTQPANGPLLIVSFTNAPNPLTNNANAIHAQIARHIVDKLA